MQRTFNAIVLVLCALAPVRALAQPYFVRATGQTSVSGVGLVEPGGLDEVGIGPIQALSASAEPDTIVAATASGQASASSSGSVGMGVMHASASVSADGVALGTAAVTGNGTLQWSDTITVVSSSLPGGTPVTLEGTLSLHRSLTGAAPASALVAASGPFGLQINDSLASPNSTQTVSATYLTTVGAMFQLGGQMVWNASGGALVGTPISAGVDASNTANFSLEVLTPEAAFTSASGATYAAAAAPVLGLIGQLGLGLGLACSGAAWARRRAG